jgi:hypothetical protein
VLSTSRQGVVFHQGLLDLSEPVSAISLTYAQAVGVASAGSAGLAHPLRFTLTTYATDEAGTLSLAVLGCTCFGQCMPAVVERRVTARLLGCELRVAQLHDASQLTPMSLTD